MKQITTQNHIAPTMTVLFFIFLIGLSIFSVSYEARQFSGDAMSSGTLRVATLFKNVYLSTGQGSSSSVSLKEI